MAYSYTEITESGHRIEAKPDGTVYVDGIVHDIAPSQMMFIRAADGLEDKPLLVGKLQEGDHLYVSWDGWSRVLGPNHGNQSCGVLNIGQWVEVHNVLSSGQYEIITLDPRTLAEPVARRYEQLTETPSTGFLDLNPTLWTHLHSPTILGGVSFFYPLRRGDWTVGNSHDNKVLVYRHSTGEVLLAWDGDTKVPPRINSSGTVAVSAEPDRPLFVTPDQFKPYNPPVTVKVDPFLQPKAIGPIWGSSEQYDYWAFAGNVDVLFGAYQQYPASDFNKVQVKRPIIAGLGALNIPANMRLGTWGYSQTEPSFVYWDARHYDQDVLFSLDPEKDVALFQAYPNPGEPIDGFITSISAQLARWPYRKMIVAAFYDRNGTLNPLPYMPAYDTLLRRSDVMGMLCFDYARSGILFDADLAAWYNAFCKATPGLPDFSVPQEPEEPPAVPYVTIKPVNSTTYEVLRVTEEVRNGKIYLNQPDGRKLSMQGDGRLDTRSHDTYGPWEEWTKTPKGYVSLAHGERYGVVSF